MSNEKKTVADGQRLWRQRHAPREQAEPLTPETADALARTGTGRGRLAHAARGGSQVARAALARARQSIAEQPSPFEPAGPQGDNVTLRRRRLTH